MKRRQFIARTSFSAVGASLLGSQLVEAQSPQWESDGVGTLARFGVLTPAFDPVPESEIGAMAPPGVSIHTARVSWTGAPRLFADPPHVDDATDQLVDLAPSAILFAFTSSSYVLGADTDLEVRNRLEKRTKGTPVILTCEAATTNLRLLGARRICVFHPPWFRDSVNEQGRAYFRAQGFDVLLCARIEPARAFVEVSPLEIFDFVSAHTPPAVDAIFIGGNGMRVAGAIRALETRLQRPVLAANQVTLCEALRRIGRAGSVTNYGSIFSKAAAGRQ